MNETPSRPPEGTTTKAVKDKSCPYCHQAFTSSSLGRHLDLYIREKNPKPPDGVHDVEAIRKLRQNITRRQPKGSASRRASSAVVGTPTTASRRSPASGDAGRSVTRSPNSSKGDLQAGVSQYPFRHRWEDTGVINDLPLRDSVARGEAEGKVAAQQLPRREPSQRSAARQLLKQQLEMRQQIQEAEDRSRAAELALRELLGSLRAAKSVPPSSARKTPSPPSLVLVVRALTDLVSPAGDGLKSARRPSTLTPSRSTSQH